MMHFKSMQEQLEIARIKAASAAKKLSLNEMAKQDDYIHSEGLNVGGGSAHNGKSRADGENRRRERKEAASILDELDAVNASFDESIMNGGGVRGSNHVMDERSFGMTMNRDDNEGFRNNYNDDDSVDSFDPDQDPLLQMASRKPLSDVSAVVIPNSQAQQYDGEKSKNKKDPNRFMADLDSRLSASNERPAALRTDSTNSDRSKSDSLDKNSLVTPLNRQKQTGSNLLESFSNSGNKMNWLRNVASPKLQESLNNVMKQVPGGNTFGIGSKYQQVHNGDENNDIEMGNNSAKKVIKARNGEDIHVLSSSSLALGDAENAELERLNQLMNKSNNNFIMSCFGLLEKNRYYLFIILTFFLTTFGYLYTRKKTDESVT